MGTLALALLRKRGIWAALVINGILAIYVAMILQYGYFF